jgi:hypothetical protein
LVANASEVESLIAGDYAYRVHDEAALRRIVIGLSTLTVESRSCFENLARFYREFVANYFDEDISGRGGYAKVAESGGGGDWADTLRLNRHDMVHYRAPWLRLEVQLEPRRYEIVLILEYRQNVPAGPQDEISLQALRLVQGYLRTALETIREELISRVRARQ